MSLPNLDGQGHREIDSLLDERTPNSYGGERPEMTVRYVDGSGRLRCKGGKDLKGSQHYPKKLLGPFLTTCNIKPPDIVLGSLSSVWSSFGMWLLYHSLKSHDVSKSLAFPERPKMSF